MGEIPFGQYSCKIFFFFFLRKKEKKKKKHRNSSSKARLYYLASGMLDLIHMILFSSQQEGNKGIVGVLLCNNGSAAGDRSFYQLSKTCVSTGAGM